MTVYGMSTSDARRALYIHSDWQPKSGVRLVLYVCDDIAYNLPKIT